MYALLTISEFVGGDGLTKLEHCMLFRTGLVVEWNVNDCAISTEKIGGLGREVKDLLLLAFLEAVETPRGFGLAGLRWLVVFERDAVHSV